jgi:hypothetical protein
MEAKSGPQSTGSGDAELSLRTPPLLKRPPTFLKRAPSLHMRAVAAAAARGPGAAAIKWRPAAAVAVVAGQAVDADVAAPAVMTAASDAGDGAHGDGAEEDGSTAADGEVFEGIADAHAAAAGAASSANAGAALAELQHALSNIASSARTPDGVRAVADVLLAAIASRGAELAPPPLSLGRYMQRWAARLLRATLTLAMACLGLVAACMGTFLLLDNADSWATLM